MQHRVGGLFAIFAHGIVGISVMVFGALELLVMREGALMTIVVAHSAMLLLSIQDSFNFGKTFLAPQP